MLIFGHIGVTYIAFFLFERMIPSLRGRFDYRYIAFGALLPDLLDKPIGRVIFAESLANGRLLGHTLVFCFFIALLGYYQYGKSIDLRKSRDIRLLLVSGACFFHILEDRMWATPYVFFWPIFGWEFPVGSYTGNLLDYFIRMFRIGYVPSLCPCFITEVLGFIIAAFILANYFRHRRAV